MAASGGVARPSRAYPFDLSVPLASALPQTAHAPVKLPSTGGLSIAAWLLEEGLPPRTRRHLADPRAAVAGGIGGYRPSAPPAPGAAPPRGRWPDAFRIVREQLREQGLESNVATCSSAVAGCSKGLQWRHALHLLKEADDSGLRHNAATYNAAASGCSRGSSSKERLWDRALALLSTSKRSGIELTVVSYGTSVAAYETAGLWQRAGAALHNAGLCGIQANAVTQVEFLNALSSSAQWQRAQRLLGSARGDGLEPGIPYFVVAIGIWEQSKQWGQALETLKTMEGGGVEPSVRALTAAMRACAHDGQWPRALEVLGSIEARHGTSPDLTALNVAAAACAASSELDQVVAMLNRMEQQGPRPDKYTYGAAISACVDYDHGYWEFALGLLERMRRRAISPDVAIRNSAMDACVAGGQAQRGLDIMLKMEKEGLQSTERTFNIALHACKALGTWSLALRLVATMRQRRLRLRAADYETAIGALVEGGQGELAAGLLRQLLADGAAALDGGASRGKAGDLGQRNAVISACASCGDWRQALRELERLSESSLRPDGFSFGAAIASCEAEGRWELAAKLVRRIHTEELKFKEIAYRNAIFLFQDCGQSALALSVLVATLAQGLEPEVQDVGAVVALCASSGAWENSASLLAELEEAGVTDDWPHYSYACSVCRPAGLWELALHHFQRADATGGADVMDYSEALVALDAAGRRRGALELYRQMLRNGVHTPWARRRAWLLDLHGLPIAVARLAVVDGLVDAKRREVRRLGIVTGRGLHSNLEVQMREVIGKFLQDSLGLSVEQDVSGGLLWVLPDDLLRPRPSRPASGWSWKGDAAHEEFVGKQAEDTVEWPELARSLAADLDAADEPPLGPADREREPRQRAAKPRRVAG